jgi:hypothetical protein
MINSPNSFATRKFNLKLCITKTWSKYSILALGINVNWFIKEHIYLSANSNKLTKKV